MNPNDPTDAWIHRFTQRLAQLHPAVEIEEARRHGRAAFELSHHVQPESAAEACIAFGRLGPPGERAAAESRGQRHRSMIDGTS